MRVPFAVALALAVTSTVVLSGCTGDTDDDLGRLQIVLLIPTDLHGWGFEHVYVKVVNITAETTDHVKRDWEPTRKSLDLAGDAVVFDDRVEEGEYENFDFWVDNTTMRGVFENGTEVPIKTQPFGNKHRVHQDRGFEVVVLGGESLRFEVRSDMVKQGEDFVWK